MSDTLSNNIIIYALDELIKSLETKKDDNNNLLKESAIRTKELIKHIEINGADYVGVTFDEYLKRLEDKPNIYLFSDEEEKELITLRRFIGVLRGSGIGIIDTNTL